MPECVDEAFLQEFVERFPLLGSISGDLFLALGVEDIDLLVSDIKVTSDDDWLVFIISEFVKVRLKVPVPLVDSVLESAQAIAGVRHICLHEDEFLELGSDNPALAVMFGDAEVVGDRDRLDLGKDSGACVSLLDSAEVPELLVLAGNLFVVVHLVYLLDVDLDLVEADNSGVGLLKELLEISSLENRIQSVDVPVPNTYFLGLKFRMQRRSLKFGLRMSLQTKEACQIGLHRHLLFFLLIALNFLNFNMD